jgi:ABC-2 type transport system ATP-binding protein
MGDTVARLRGVSKRFAAFDLSEVDLNLRRGEVMGLVGPNGAGKTTTIRLLLGLARPTQGEVELLGRDPAKDARARERVGFVFDEMGFIGNLPCLDNEFFLKAAYPDWDGRAFRDYLSRFGIDGKKRLEELSRGQKTKFALACALSHGAELLVLDEPTSGLDPVSRSEILDLIYEFIQDGQRSVLFSTHITQDLEKVADTVTFLRDGRLVFSKETAELLEGYALAKGPISALGAALPHLMGRREGLSGFEAIGEREALATIPGLILEKPSLDDIVVFSTREDYRVDHSA